MTHYFLGGDFLSLYEGIMQQIIAREVMASMESADRAALVHDAAYQSLCRIREILDDKTLDDLECFQRIERIVSVFDSLGCTISRHKH